MEKEHVHIHADEACACGVHDNEHGHACACGHEHAHAEEGKKSYLARLVVGVAILPSRMSSRTAFGLADE